MAPKLRQVLLHKNNVLFAGDSHVVRAFRTAKVFKPTVPIPPNLPPLARSGATSNDVFNWLYEAERVNLSHYVVVVNVGTNDVRRGISSADYNENLRQIISLLKEEYGCQRVIIMVPTPTGFPFDPKNPTAYPVKPSSIRSFRSIVLHLNSLPGVTAIDTWVKFMKKTGPQRNMSVNTHLLQQQYTFGQRKGQPDLIHWSDLGFKVIKDLIEKALAKP